MPIERKNLWEIESLHGLPCNNSMNVEQDIQHISNLSSSRQSPFHGFVNRTVVVKEDI